MQVVPADQIGARIERPAHLDRRLVEAEIEPGQRARHLGERDLGLAEIVDRDVDLELQRPAAARRRLARL